MQDTPKILKAIALNDYHIQVQYADGVRGKFLFSDYFEYLGYFEFLKDINQFLNLKVDEDGCYIYWTDPDGEEVEIDPAILYSICTQQKIIIDEKVVFDPSLGKQAWL
jgi:hypothetical protein